jgi:hypothetical protein
MSYTINIKSMFENVIFNVWFNLWNKVCYFIYLIWLGKYVFNLWFDVLFNAILKCVWFIVITHYVGN